MKNFFLGAAFALLASLCGVAAAQPSSLELASAADNTCMVRHVYANAGAASAEAAAQQAAVERCITLESGSGAWYVQQRAKRGNPPPSAQQADAFVQKTRALAGAVLKQVLGRCASSSLDEAGCLAMLEARRK